MPSPSKIFLSDLAPAETVHFTFASAEFDLSGKKSYTTEDPAVIGEATAHYWLRVESPSGDAEHAAIAAGTSLEEQEAERGAVAIDAGKEQTEVVVTGDVAETLAADHTSKTAAKAEKGS